MWTYQVISVWGSEDTFKAKLGGVKANLKVATLRYMGNSVGELFCPTDKFALSRIGDKLVCVDGHNFSITQGIPQFTNEGYASAFGYQWNVFQKLNSILILNLQSPRNE